MIEPIKNAEQINGKIIREMSRECINPSWFKNFFTSNKDEIFLLTISKEQVALIRAVVCKNLHHQQIARKLLLYTKGNRSTLLVHGYSKGTKKGFIRNFNSCTRRNYCKSMKEIYDLFETYVENLEKGQCDCNIFDLGLTYEETSTKNDPEHEDIYGIKPEEVKKLFIAEKGNQYGSQNNDERYC